MFSIRFQGNLRQHLKTTRSALSLFAAFCCLQFGAAQFIHGQTFTNPLFNGGDPWITYQNGMYYYSESYCGAAAICIKASATLTGLATAPWVGVWNPGAPSNPNGTDIWAPEVHLVNGQWYIYYAADSNANNNLYRLFVLQADTSNPQGSYSEGNTGLPHGQLNESTGNWAVDPDVFTAGDGNLYITWSCTNYSNSTFPQRICLAPMSNPLSISGNTVPLSTPTQYWETRDAPIQEGPVGYTRNGNTYITYSGSASWIANDYAAGILINTTQNMLVPTNWVKDGPILDHHGTTYGPGSVVFVQSIDGSEYWNLYHAIDSSTCLPAYNCRDIRMQQMFFDPIGYPVLGYPVNPSVPLKDPSGEGGVPSGTWQIADWGNAWGDAAEGMSTGQQVGTWNWSNRFGASSSIGGSWDQIFSPWNPNYQNFDAHVEVQWIQTGTTHPYPKYGYYCSYDDVNNHAKLFLDITDPALFNET